MTAITILGILWEALKGIITIIPTLNMFNKTNCPTYNIKIEKVEIYNPIIVNDVAAALQVAKERPQIIPHQETEETANESPNS